MIIMEIQRSLLIVNQHEIKVYKVVSNIQSEIKAVNLVQETLNTAYGSTLVFLHLQIS